MSPMAVRSEEGWFDKSRLTFSDPLYDTAAADILLLKQALAEGRDITTVATALPLQHYVEAGVIWRLELLDLGTLWACLLAGTRGGPAELPPIPPSVGAEQGGPRETLPARNMPAAVGGAAFIKQQGGAAEAVPAPHQSGTEAPAVVDCLARVPPAKQQQEYRRWQRELTSSAAAPAEQEPPESVQPYGPDRFYCPFPGCQRSFAELWRLKVHYRAPPEARGSGTERGHGTELDKCPKCEAVLRPGKHHRACAGLLGPRPPTKRQRQVMGYDW